jgi:hypothetical protein
MTVKLQLKPEVEAGLLAPAQARGLSLEAYLEQILQERSRTPTPPSIGPAERARLFERWANRHPLTPPLPDEAVRRENLVHDAQCASSSTPTCC